MNQLSDRKVNVIVLGDAEVGKTTFCQKITDKDPSFNSYVTTIRVEPLQKTISNANRKLTINFYDTPGQPRFANKYDAYLTADCYIILIFDTSKPTQFSNLQKYIDEIQRKNCKKLFLIGNNKDKNPQVDTSAAEVFAKQNNMHYLQASIKDATNFNNILDIISHTDMRHKKTSPEEEERKFSPQSRTTNDPCYDFILNTLINLTIILTGVIPYLLFCLAMNKNYTQENKEVRGNYLKFFGDSTSENDTNNIELANTIQKNK